MNEERPVKEKLIPMMIALVRPTIALVVGVVCLANEAVVSSFQLFFGVVQRAPLALDSL